MAVVQLGSKPVGSIVKIKVNGTLRNFIVVHQGRPSTLYDASCDGAWLLMEDIYENRPRDYPSSNDYANSTFHTYLNSTILGLFDTNIQAQIKQVKIPYRPGASIDPTPINGGANGLPAKIFMLSGKEVGSGAGYTPEVGANLDYFKGTNSLGSEPKRVAKLNGSAEYWWLRSPYCGYPYNSVEAVIMSGQVVGIIDYPSACGIRPALILPSSLLVSNDGTVTTNTAPTTPASITVPSSIQGGSNITVSWGASTDKESNLAGYIVERSTNGGSSWTQIYQGGALSTVNNVAFGTASVMYRVKAYDTEGLYSGYKTSASVTVVNNSAPYAPASIAVPNAVLGGATLTVTWGAGSDADGNLAGYSLERQVGGGAWTVIYTGAALSYTDTITKGWASVAYRVRAYDSYNAYSGYATSPTRTVNNNTAPVITCASSSGSDLGVKSSGFAVSYTVSDVDGDKVSVTEAIDGVAKRTFTASLGTSNTFQLADEVFMTLLNGKHTLTITANDGKANAAHSLTFTKEVTAASITLEAPMEADAEITICVISVSGFIPADAKYTVEVTNNALDDAPVWEDCTIAVKTGANHIFGNRTAVNGFAFNFRVAVERGASGVGGYITSIQGGFQ